MEPIRNSRKRNRSGQRLSRFVFTLNNYTEAEYLWLTETFAPLYKPKWFIVGKEVGGKKATPHLQGACVLGLQRAFSVVMAWPGFRRAHVETMKGTPGQSETYCSKDGDFFEYGSLPEPGKRNDLAVAVQAINDGQSLREMAEGDHGVAVVKFYKGLTVLRSLRSKPRNPSDPPPACYWLYGATGTGKTKCAWELGLSFGGADDIWMSNGNTQWFDAYDGQPVVIFDDFRSKGTVFAFLLRLTDRYPMLVPFKGGFVNWAPPVIIFTSPNCIRNTFSKRLFHVPEDICQFERRMVGEYSIPTEEPIFRELFASPGLCSDVDMVDSQVTIVISSSSSEEDEHVDETYLWNLK